MKISPILILILLCLDFQSVNANSTYEWGDTLHIWATSGLNMREGPGTDFPKIKKLEYGEPVKVIDDYLRSTPLSITVIKKSKDSDAFNLKGHWVRVLIGTQEGYVFDGYLSRLPVLRITKKDNPSLNKSIFYSERLETYLRREFILQKENLQTPGEDEWNSWYYFDKKIKFLKGGNHGCGWSGVNIPNISKNEAFLLFNIFGQLEQNLGLSQEENNEYGTGLFINSLKNSNEKLEIYLGDGGMCVYSLTFDKNGTSIHLECCC